MEQSAGVRIPPIPEIYHLFFAFVCISGMCGGVGVALGLFLGPAKEIDESGCEKNKEKMALVEYA
jgi:hypothetical protein